MPRDIPVGNGTLLITFDQDYCLRDIYYPFVGKENHTGGHKFRLGVWVDEKYDWVGRDWGLRLDYAYEMLMTQVTAANDRLGLSLHCHDMVDYRENIFIKPYVLNFVECVQPILVLKVSYYIASDERVVHPNRNQGVIAVRVISGTNTI